ncbi:MAG TPA: hypothetical protein VF811_04770 [Parasulfuritortus sp.]
MNCSVCAPSEADPAVVVAPYFDAHGRCLPAELKAGVHRNTRRYFIVNQPAIDYAAIYRRSAKHLGSAQGPSEAEFEWRASAILRELRDDPATAPLLNGVGVPFLLPREAHTDVGEALQDVYLQAVSASFSEAFPHYAFTNHHQAGLAGKLSVVSGSRHDRLVEAMAHGPVVGYFFPCLTEYSVPAAIEQMASLPDKFLLAGGYDTSAALVGSPDLLLRTDGYPPLLWLAALQGESEQLGYHYEAYGYNLTFNRRPHFGRVAEYWSSGLVVLG